MTREKIQKLREKTQDKLQSVYAKIDVFAEKNNLNKEQSDFLWEICMNYSLDEKIPDFVWDKTLGQERLNLE